jgi:ankyrin repeat protein
MQAGAPVTVKDKRGSSTVEWACWCNKHTIGEYLIQMGADKNHADRLNGNPPLFSALTSQAYECLEMLLSHGVDVLHVSNTGSTVLHWMARSGDARMLRIMQSRKLQFEKVDTSSRDCSGRTAAEVLQSTRCSESFRLEFMQFLHDLTSLQTVRSSQIEKANTPEKAEGGFRTRARCGYMTKGLFYT